MEIDFNKRSEFTANSYEAPVKKRKWDRYLYFFILALLVFSLLKWLIPTVIYHDADGLLLQQEYSVKFTEDTRILNYTVSEGQQVSKGDTLFSYEQTPAFLRDEKYTRDSLSIAAEANRAQNSLIALDAEIKKRKFLISDLEKRIRYWQNVRPQKEKLVYLNSLSPGELSSVDRTLDDIFYQLSQLKTEYRVLTEEYRKRDGNIRTTAQIAARQNHLTKSQTFFYAPVSGRIDRLRIGEGQVCKSNEVVTTLLNPEYVVKAYIKLEELDQFKLNDEVVVHLPYGFDGTLKGKISRIYAVSEIKAENLSQNDRNNTENYGIVMDIIPVNKAAWAAVNVSNIPVKVRKSVFAR